MIKEDFVKEKEIIKKIVVIFDVGKVKFYFGFILFSIDVYICVKFGDYLNLCSFQDVVDKILFVVGGICFDKVFGEVVNGFFFFNGGVCFDFFKVMIIFIDGKQSVDYDVVLIERFVFLLCYFGVCIFVLVIGS